jgi:hypothetical protein
MFLLALCGADHVKDSVKAAELYSRCVLDERDELPTFAPLAGLGPRHKLLKAVEAIIRAYETGDVPLTEASMVLPGGQITAVPKKPSVFLILTSPPPANPARIGINQDVIAEYRRSLSTKEMFAGVAEGSKRRVAAKGDLQIEKRVSSATFSRLGEMLRDAT